MAFDERTAERVRHLLADRHDVHEKRMFGGLAFIAKGGMCCAVSGRGGLLVRVDPDEQARLVVEPHARPMIMGGRPVSSFVRVQPEGYRTHASLKKWVQRGLDAVAAQPAKPKRQRTRKKALAD